MAAYFKSAGYECPIHYNPADFILELVTDNFVTENESLKDKEKIKSELMEHWKKYTQTNNTLVYKDDATVNKIKRTSIDYCAGLTESDEDNSVTASVEDSESSSTTRWNTGWWEQFKILFVRAFKHRRGHLWSWVRCVELAGTAILGGLVWFRIEHIEENIQDYMAASYFLTSYLMFSTMYRGVVHFPLERNVIKKER